MRIKVNGAPVETGCASLFALVPDRTDRVVIVNGYQTADDLPLSEGDSVTVIQKGVMPPADVLSHMLAARMTPGVYEKVRTARVGIAGLGGLGSHIAYALARTGVGCLHLVDFDVVEPSNLNRQQYRVADLGRAKTEALAEGLRAVNPYVRIETDCVRVTPENAASLFADDPIVCEAFDNPDAKAMLVDCLLTECPDTRIVAASGMAGHDTANTIVTRRLTSRLYLCGDGETGAAPGRGLEAPRVSVCAGHQANMALRLILGEEQP